MSCGRTSGAPDSATGAGRATHQNWEHPQVARAVGLAGQDGDDAQPYQERAVREALAELGRAQKGLEP